MTEQAEESGLSWNDRVIAEFRANGGKVGGMFADAPMALLTTAGRRTGRPHTNPVVYRRDGERYLVFGSNAGRPADPEWYLNLLAAAQVTMELGAPDGHGEPIATRAVVLEGAERDREWERQCVADPSFREYEKKTSRPIPVIALHPLDLSKDTERNRMVGRQLIAHHDDLRRDLGDLRARIAGALDGDGAADATQPADFAAQLRTTCLTFCYGLQMHHIREDGSFTAFERQFPELSSAIGRLREEHKAVEQKLEAFEAVLAKGPAEGPEGLRALLDELDRTVQGLEEHFAYEEEHLLPKVGAARPAAATPAS